MSEHTDTSFDPPKFFIPIDEGARDGRRQLVKKGHDYAAAMWTGDFWSYPFGRGSYGEGAGPCAVEIDFEPTHYAPKGSAS